MEIIWEENMKFIHLSDLHIGKRVNEFSMIEDQKYILRQVIERKTGRCSVGGGYLR